MLEISVGDIGASPRDELMEMIPGSGHSEPTARGRRMQEANDMQTSADVDLDTVKKRRVQLIYEESVSQLATPSYIPVLSYNMVWNILQSQEDNSLSSPTSASAGGLLEHLLAAKGALSQVGFQFADAVAESEYVVYLTRSRTFGLVIGVASSSFCLTEMCRMYPVFYSTSAANSFPVPSWSSHAAIGGAVASLVSWTVFIVVAYVLRRPVLLHDSKSAQMTRNAIRANAALYEWLLSIAFRCGSLFLITYLAYENVCPFIETPDGYFTFCRFGFGFAMPLLLSLCLITTISPLRLYAMITTLTWNLSVFALAHVLISTSLSGAVRLGEVRWDVSSVISGRLLFAFGAFVAAGLGCAPLERRHRFEFQRACALEVQRIEVSLSNRALSKQITATVPLHVARRLLSGAPICDLNPEGVILVFGIPQFTMICSTKSAAEVVELLNRTFSALDKVVSESCLSKMQTLGDMYVIVGGITSSPQCRHRAMIERYKCRPADVLATVFRKLATNMQFRTCAFVPSAIALHVGPVAGVVLGSQLAYVAIGDGVTHCTAVMRQCTHQCVTLTPTFEEALLAGARLDWVPELQASSFHAPREPLLGEEADIELAESLLQHVHGKRSRRSALDSSDAAAKNPPIDSSVFADESFALVMVTFKRPEVEREYLDSVEATAVSQMTIYQHIVTFVEAAVIQVLHIVSWSVGTSPLEDSHYGIVVNIFTLNAVIAMGVALVMWIGAAHFDNKTVLYFQQFTWWALLSLHHVGYWLLLRYSFLLNNVLPQILVLLMLSIRRSTGYVLRDIAADVTFVVGPMLALQLDVPFAFRPASFTGTATEIHITLNDKIVMATQYVYMVGFLPLSFTIGARIVKDRRSREQFATHRELERNRAISAGLREQMQSFASTVVPQFALERFREFAMLNQSSSRPLGDRIDPWQGSWFATAMMDIPVAMVLLATTPNATTTEQWHQLERGHALVDEVLHEPSHLAAGVCRVKSVADTILFMCTVGDDCDKANRLFNFATALYERLDEEPLLRPKIVLNCGLTLGAVIGTASLTFEMFGEPVFASVALLAACPASCLIATQRFISMSRMDPPNIQSELPGLPASFPAATPATATVNDSKSGSHTISSATLSSSSRKLASTHSFKEIADKLSASGLWRVYGRRTVSVYTIPIGSSLDALPHPVRSLPSLASSVAPCE